MAEVAVVGAGLGGLSAAIHLATSGHRVTLFERTGALGGKAARLESNGFSWDTGPSLLTMPEVVDELFAAAGERRADAIELLRLPLQCRYLFPDGKAIDLVDDLDETVASVEKAGSGEGERWRGLVGLTRQMNETIGRPFLDHPFDGWGSFAKLFLGAPVASLRFGLLQGSLESLAGRRLRSEAMRWILHRYATYAGGGPKRTPSSFATIVEVETRGGAFYPQGGIGALVEAIGGLARRAGVTLVTGADVQRLVVEAGVVKGLVVDGTERRFDAVVSNADPVTVGERLLTVDEAKQAGLTRHQTQELGLSGFVLLLGVRGRLDSLAHHTVVFPEGYDDEFADLFDRDRMPERPTVYLCVPSRTDPTRAPSGDESLFAMINAPANAHRADWEALRPVAIERIKRAIERVVPDLRDRIVCESSVGPGELRSRFGAPGGSIYGVSPHGRLSPFHRPRARSKLGGLYFAGGGTHPGGGIPLVLRSGKFAAQLAATDLERGLTRAPREAA
jgi:phytoene desaturase